MCLAAESESLLFVVRIVNINENIVNMVRKFADYSTIGGVVDCEDGYLRLQNDSDDLGNVGPMNDRWNLTWTSTRYCFLVNKTRV